MQTRTCTKCRRELPDTAENFVVCYGRHLNRCRNCHNICAMRLHREKCAREPIETKALQIWRARRLSAGRKGIVFEITSKWVADQIRRQACQCRCCNRTMRMLPGGGRVNDNSPTIDRVDPRGGYTEANCRIVCWRCNTLKRDATAPELRRIVEYIERCE